MDALELALHCSSLMRPLQRTDQHDSGVMETSADSSLALSHADASTRSHARMDETECERHFKICGMFSRLCKFEFCLVFIMMID